MNLSQLLNTLRDKNIIEVTFFSTVVNYLLRPHPGQTEKVLAHAISYDPTAFVNGHGYVVIKTGRM